MEGKVLAFDANDCKGVILSNEKNRYSFEISDWLAKEAPKPGKCVDFIGEDGRAKEIYVDISGISTYKPSGKFEYNSEKTPPTIVYICYLCSVLVGITSIFGVIIAYVYRSGSNEFIKSHYNYQIKTFWNVLIGTIFGFGLIIQDIGAGYLFLVVVFIWYLYRIARGWANLSREIPMQ